MSTSFNGRILDVIRVSTEPFLKDDFGTNAESKRKRDRAAEAASKTSARDARVNRRRQRDIESQMIDTTGAA